MNTDICHDNTRKRSERKLNIRYMLPSISASSSQMTDVGERRKHENSRPDNKGEVLIIAPITISILPEFHAVHEIG
jgi:hypothetical protein